ncbi:hypothetical protein F5Y09DRAFT_340453 [Xylaria sp. FL1042]|nr:hypothetical protein F5Y09DRAFT_340453 [Xylaria sp. FL1042]
MGAAVAYLIGTLLQGTVVLAHPHYVPQAWQTVLLMQGPSELVITENLKDWEGWMTADQINVDTLIVNGRYYDEITDICVEP